MIPLTPLDAGIGVFMIALALGTIGSQNPVVSLAAFLPWPGVLASYYGSLWAGKNRGEQLLFCAWLILVITSLFGLVYHRDNRLAGLTDSPNTLAVLLNMTLAGAMPRFARKTGRMAILGTIGLVLLTRSRSGIIGLALMLLVYFLPTVLRAKRRRGFARKTVLIVAGVGLLLIAIRPDSLTLLNDYTANRLAFWGVAWEMFSQYPILGAGLGTFGQFYSSQYEGFPFSSAHNWAMQTAAEMGLVGLAGLGGMAVGLVAYCTQNGPAVWRAKRHILAALAAFIWHCQLDTPGPIVLALAAILAGLLIDKSGARV